MAIKDLFKKKESNKNLSYATFMNDTPIFSQFGEDVYASDIVRSSIDAIARECSKLEPKHIRKNSKGVIDTPASSLNAIFNYKANPFMTMADFITKIIWQLYLEYNVFIYPIYETYMDSNGIKRKRYKAFYPLNPIQVDFLTDPQNELWVRFLFKQGKTIQLPYSSIIHLRNQFSVNDIMGGDYTGNPDNTALLNLIKTDSVVVEGLAKAVKSGLAVRGFLKYNTVLSDENQEEEIAKFEAKLDSGDSGFMPLDLKSEYKEVKIDPKVIDSTTMEFIDKRILRTYGTSTAIVSGDFNEAQYQAFYEKILEPIMNSLGQAFTANIFTAREISVGNRIVFYPKNMMYLSINSKLAIIKTAGEQGLLTNDQKLQILGLPPIGGDQGAMRTMSLNYVDVQLANEYQMAKAKAPQLNVQGGNNNEE